MSQDEAADHLHLPPRELQAMIDRRVIPCHRVAGRIVFRRDEIECWYRRRLLEMRPEELSRYLKEGAHLSGSAMARGPLLPGLLDPGSIHPALTCRTGPSLLRTMTALADATGHVVYPDDLLVSLKEREALASTALPGGLALLHPLRHDPFLFEASFIVLGRTVQAIPFHAPDGERTRLFFLLCCGDPRLHLQAMARLALAVSMAETLDRLLTLEQAPDLRDTLLAAERAVLAEL